MIFESSELEYDNEKMIVNLDEIKYENFIVPCQMLVFCNYFFELPSNQKNRKLKTITENVGIEIQAKVGTQVITVLDGVISTITYIRGHGNIIIVDHGGGFSTVYAQVENIQVNENEYIQAGDRLAKIASNGKSKNGKLHFEVWGNQQKLNPEHWLSKK